MKNEGRREILKYSWIHKIKENRETGENMKYGENIENNEKLAYTTVNMANGENGEERRSKYEKGFSKCLISNLSEQIVQLQSAFLLATTLVQTYFKPIGRCYIMIYSEAVLH